MSHPQAADTVSPPMWWPAALATWILTLGRGMEGGNVPPSLKWGINTPRLFNNVKNLLQIIFAIPIYTL
jgi:hypothetical protein